MAINTTYTVYTHTDPYGKKYIGITKRNLEDRWKNGLGYATNKDMRFFDAIRTIGWDNFTHETVASGLTKLEAEKLESELIDKYNTTNPEYGYNIFNPKKKENGEIPNKQWVGYIRATAELGQQLQQIADVEFRSVNNLVVHILTQYVENYQRNNKV